MDINKISEEFKAIRNEYDEAVKRIRENGGLKDIFNSFFTENPHITGIVWSQYIPSFNDGEPCLFGLGEIYFSASKEIDWDEISDPYDVDDYEDGGEAFHSPTLYKWNSETKTTDTVPNPDFISAAKTIYDFIYQNESLMQDLFGDNSLVVVTPDKIRVEEYDCGY